MWKATFLLAGVLAAKYGLAFIAYDCVGHGVNTSIIALQDVQPCPQDNEIMLISGITCPLRPNYCMDSTFGETVWQMDQPTTCPQQLSILYEGEAHLITSRNSDRFLVVEQQEKVFALKLYQAMSICDRELFQTEHPHILVLNTTQTQVMKDVSPMIAENINLLTYLNSKLLYIEQAYKRSIEDVYIDTITRRCELKREMLKTKLLMATLMPHEVGWLLKQQPGYFGRVLGEVIYVMQCVPRPVALRRTNKCYHELPVTSNNQSKFMAPMTHILQNEAEELDCNHVTPPLYLINNQWIGMSPLPIVSATPTKLRVEAEVKLKFSPVSAISSGGLYTQNEILKSQRLITDGISRKAVQNILIRKLQGEDPNNQGYSMIKLFDTKELKAMAKSTLQYLWGAMTDFGMVCNGLVGIYFSIKIIKAVINLILNGFRLYELFGCSWKLVASVWSGLTMWMIHRKTYPAKNGTEEEGRSIEVTVTQPTQSNGPFVATPSAATELINNAYSADAQNNCLYPDIPRGHWTSSVAN